MNAGSGAGMLWINLLSIYGSAASLAGLAITVRDPNRDLSNLEVATYTFAAALLILGTFLTVRSHYRNRPRVCKTTESIRTYMQKWIGHPGRVLIFTRDMTWASNEDVKSALIEKARHDELTVILERRIPIAEELEKFGARVATYESLRHTPASRFTIINKDRQDAQVAVGGKIGNKHVIHEFQQGHHPYFSVANDLAEILLKFNQLSTAEKK